ncbi:hypothetical protein MRB53_018629 [Persea americana]|uniref:Uncharacterized protein n=1 Tax=Persea americana TaxID=3435 RepID=A0ACC2M8F4_PERAE|nr:hypothetical protein MRB53_018629 [Persea americana]
MVSADAPVLLAKACELFIMELTLISWLHAEEEKRRTVRRSDLEDAIRHKETFHFLDDAIPKDEMKEEGLDGNWLRTESFPNDRTEFPLMPANPIDQALGEDFMSRLQEIFQQPMVQQVPMSNFIPPTVYGPPQDFMSRPQEIFHQSMIQQPLMSTLNPITLPELPQELVLDGNWVSTESFPNHGMSFPLMPASPINQALGEDFMSRSQEIFLPSMIQQPLMSTLTPTTVYEPTQEIFQQAMQATVYDPLHEIFQQPMQQPLVSTLTPAIVYEPAQEIFQQSMIQQPLMSTMTPAAAYELPQPYTGSMPPDLMGQGPDRT